MKNKTHYAKPGADESFLHPEISSQWAPREITVYAKDDILWLSWIHRNGGDEYPVYTFKKHNLDNELIRIESGFSYYSKPLFIQGADNFNPDIVLFAGDEKNCSLRIYEISSNNVPECRKILGTNCSSVYHTDGIRLSNGDIYIIYGGITKNRKGVSVYMRKKISGKWHEEEELRLENHSLNRPKLVKYGKDNIIAVADAYRKGVYFVCWIDLSKKNPQWHKLYSDSGWNMFPSIAVDTNGKLWACWLNSQTVRRENIAGMKQHAMLACFESGEWKLFNDHGKFCADLNLGLLPLKRYFGYDGLRRYPRLAALNTGEILLVWEQQKDEDEIWENLANGFLLGKILNNESLSDTIVLAKDDCCFTFDNKKTYSRNDFLIAAKSEHRISGDDFIVKSIDISNVAKYQHEKSLSWEDWMKDDFRTETSKASRVKIKSAEDKKLNLYWGDLHCHSVHSPDAEGEIDELYNFAKDIAGLDFVAITDNDFYPHKVLLDSEIKYIADTAEAVSGDDFLGMSGFEWTFHRPDESHSFNHRIIIYPNGKHSTIRRNEPEGYTEKQFSRYIANSGYFSFPHHGYWKMLGGETAVEVTSAWGTYILDADTVFNALNAGNSFSFLGNSDSHRFMPGLSGALTGVFAEDLSHEAIIDAIKKGRCFATTGNRTSTLFYVNDCFMGGTLKSDKPPVVRWEISPHGELENVKIIRNGQTVHTSRERCGKWLDKSVSSGKHWYILEVKEKGEYKRYPHNVASAFGKYLWTSPIWILR